MLAALQGLSKLSRKLGEGLSLSQDRIPQSPNGAH